MTDIRTAILEAADHIEAHPEDFREVSASLPNLLGIGDGAFYGRMDELTRCEGWPFDVKKFTRTLRAYADRWHPSTQLATQPPIPADA